MLVITLTTSQQSCKKKPDQNPTPDKSKTEILPNQEPAKSKDSTEESVDNDKNTEIISRPLGMPEDTLVRQLIEKYNNPQKVSKSDVLNELFNINSEESLRGIFQIALSEPPGELKIEICQKILNLNIRGREDFFIGSLSALDQESSRAVSQLLGLHANQDLIEKIISKCDTEKNPEIKARYLSVIENSTVPDAVAPLMSVLTDPNSSIDDEVVYSSAKALAKNGSPPSMSALLSKIDSTVNKHEVEQLDGIISVICEPESEQALIYGAMGNKDTKTTQGRVSAIKALSNYPTQESLQTLKSLTSDPDVSVRKSAQNSLEKLSALHQ